MNTGSGSRYSRCFLFRLVLFTTGIIFCRFPAQASPVEIVAHRGGYQLYPENTLAAFQACSGLVDRIELDVRTTADGELVVMHDETVNRTTVGYQAITNESGYALTNVYGAYHFAKDWSVFASVNNVFDRDYEMAADYATPGTNGFVGIRYSPK